MNNEAFPQATCLRGAESEGGFTTPNETKKVITDDARATETELTPSSSEIVLLKSEELAARWRISRQRLNQMRVAGQIKVIRLPGGGFRYSLAEILRLEKPLQGCRQEKKARPGAAAAQAAQRGEGRTKTGGKVSTG